MARVKKITKVVKPIPEGNRTENKYQEGALVSERVHPYRKFRVQRYLHRVYYCQLLSDPEHAELMFHEREIMQDAVAN